jgi:hypothetical protein
MISRKELKSMIQHDISVLFDNIEEYMQIYLHADKRALKALKRRKLSLLQLLKMSK